MVVCPRLEQVERNGQPGMLKTRGVESTAFTGWEVGWLLGWGWKTVWIEVFFTKRSQEEAQVKGGWLKYEYGDPKIVVQLVYWSVNDDLK